MRGCVIRKLLRGRLFFLGGLACTVILAALYILAGGGIPADIHDTLDCELFSLILQAKSPGPGSHPEFMNGAWSALSLVSPGSLLFYVVLPPLQAFSLNAAFVLLIAYIGCYLCLRRLCVRGWVAALTALLFSLLPFYSVFGLCIMGAPIAFLALLQAIDSDPPLWRPLLLCGLYGAFSSLSQVGFAVLAVFFTAILVCAVRGKRKAMRRVLACLILLGGIYVVENATLILQVAGLGDFPVSHRAEFVLPSGDFRWGEVRRFFVEGHYHAPSNHRWVLVLMLTSLVVFSARLMQRDIDGAQRRLATMTVVILLFACAIAIVYVCYQTTAGNPLRQVLPASLQSLQLDRFYWLYPALWYLGLGLSAELLLRSAPGWLLNATALSVILFCMMMTAGVSGPEGQFVRNAKTAVLKEAPTYITWDRFFEEGLFDEIKEELIERNGGSDDFKVASIGLYPSIPLFNGFFCLDGYSNYYDLEYKHRFRELIAGELAENPVIREYFDTWGNRCYVFSHELGANYLFPKDGGRKIEDLRIDLDVFCEMGGRYLFCGVPIENPEGYGLSLVGEYSTEESYYAVWVYEVDA